MKIHSAITRFHAKYYAAMLAGQSANGDLNSLSQSLLSSTVDINPHQIDAALFAFNSPFSKGVVLADEVGLGKTIEAGLVLCQYWATGKRKLLVVCPASLRKQWEAEHPEEAKAHYENELRSCEQFANELGDFGKKILQEHDADYWLNYNSEND